MKKNNELRFSVVEMVKFVQEYSCFADNCYKSTYLNHENVVECLWIRDPLWSRKGLSNKLKYVLSE